LTRPRNGIDSVASGIARRRLHRWKREDGTIPFRVCTMKAILLDVDGTLIDSNDAHAQAWVDAGAEFGFEIEFAGSGA
jgi:hypothetical protein